MSIMRTGPWSTVFPTTSNDSQCRAPFSGLATGCWSCLGEIARALNLGISLPHFTWDHLSCNSVGLYTNIKTWEPGVNPLFHPLVHHPRIFHDFQEINQTSSIFRDTDSLCQLIFPCRFVSPEACRSQRPGYRLEWCTCTKVDRMANKIHPGSAEGVEGVLETNKVTGIN